MTNSFLRGSAPARRVGVRVAAPLTTPGGQRGGYFGEPTVRASPLKTPPTTKGIRLWNPELLPWPNQSILNRLATKSPQQSCGLFSLFTRRHKLQALYPDGKLIVYSKQELMTKPPSLCQPTEAATVRRIRKGETSPLRRLLLLAFWRRKRLTRRAGAEPRKG